MFKKLRDPVSGLTHLGAAIAALVGLVFLVGIGHDSLIKAISLAIYGLSLVLMFTASAAYHLIQPDPQRSGSPPLNVLRKLDHSAIYVLIAGTYTPICLHFFRGFWQWGMVGIIWGIAIVGIGAKVGMHKTPRWLSAGLYVLMGWLALLAGKEIVAAMPLWALIWLLLGGVLFTVGAVVYVTRWPDLYPGRFGFHEVWHLFVILGCACHYIIMAAFVAPSAI